MDGGCSRRGNGRLFLGVQSRYLASCSFHHETGDLSLRPGTGNGSESTKSNEGLEKQAGHKAVQSTASALASLLPG